MKRLPTPYIMLVIALLLSVLFAATSVSAHAGGPPYVKVNGEYAVSNPILNTTQPTSFIVGLDVASASGLLVGLPIHFEVDEQFFPNPYAQAQSPFGIPVVNQPPAVPPLFRWDFQDGSEKVEGKKVVHTFTKAGTYIVDLDAKFPGKTEEYTTVDTIQMTVLPSKSYVSPAAKIIINGTLIENPLRDTTPIKPVSPVPFDASASTGNIVKYQWDFGDGKSSDKSVTSHRYSRDEYFPVVVLRVTDENNIVSDTYGLLDMPIQKSDPIHTIFYTIVDFITGLFYKE